MREQETEAAPNQKLPLFVKSISKRSTPTDWRRTMWLGGFFPSWRRQWVRRSKRPIFGSHLSSQIAKSYPAAAWCRIAAHSVLGFPTHNPTHKKYVLYELPRTLAVPAVL